MDIFYNLTYSEEGVFIVINPSLGFIGPKIRSKIQKSLERRQIRGLDIEKLKTLYETPGVEGKIAEAQEEKTIDEEVFVAIDKNQMRAMATFMPPEGGRLLTSLDFDVILKELSITHGVNQTILYSLSENLDKQYGEPIVFAQGTEAVNGSDAHIEYHFNTTKARTPAILPDGTVDHKNLDFIHNVKKGDLLATLHKETEGTKGKNIFGMEILPQRGKPKILPKGKNTEISQDSLRLYASTDGRVEIINGKITVIRILEINGDVGVPTGHIEFLGDVVISGSVISKYNVTATGSIQVGGCIENSIISAGRHIVIRQGIKGMSECVVKAGGDITSKFIENAHVTANGLVRADFIMHSTVSSNGSVVVFGKHGNIIGGVTRAVKDVACMNIGGVSAKLTEFEVGMTTQAKQSFIDLEKEVESLHAELLALKSELNIFNSYKDKELFSSKQRNRFNILQAKCEWIEEILPSKIEVLDSLRELSLKSYGGKVHVRDTMLPTTWITIGAKSTKITEKRSGLTFKYLNSEIISLPFEFKDN